MLGGTLKIPIISRVATQRLVYFLAPKNRWGDKLVGLYWFLRSHNRLPTNKANITDMLYRMKTSDEMLDPTRAFVTDKEYSKLFVKGVLGVDRCAPTFTVLTTPEEIDAYDFPAKCCIKPTQASGAFILRKNGEDIDREDIKEWLTLNYYDTSYKTFCYGGQPKMIQVDNGRDEARQISRFDTNWVRQDGFIDEIPVVDTLERPANLEQMLHAAEKLAQHFPLSGAICIPMAKASTLAN